MNYPNNYSNNKSTYFVAQHVQHTDYVFVPGTNMTARKFILMNKKWRGTKSSDIIVPDLRSNKS